MLTTKTTLVLGAGSSLAMGYPLGSGLRRKILALATHDEATLTFRIESGLQHKQNELWDFLDAFSKSQALSIDSFLARRSEFMAIGKHAIAAVMLACEAPNQLHETDHPDHWYQYLFHGLAKDDWASVDFSNLSIVTFNYDRSLEEYLLQSLMASYKKTRDEACAKLRELEIVHVYGALGNAEPWSSNYLEYGLGFDASRCLAAATSIEVIPEGRDNAPSVIKARDLLHKADVLAVLGFGFDALNLKRLNSAATFARVVKRGEQRAHRALAATCLGMTRREALAAFDQLGRRETLGTQVNSLPSGFVNGTCLEMLRETLILGDPY